MRRVEADPVNESIRQRIRRIRKEKKLTSREVANLSGIPESSYFNMENGFYRIALHNLYRIVKALGAAIEDVWPLEQVYCPAGSLPLGDVNALAGFRFIEICRLTSAEKGALLSEDERLQVMYSTGMSEQEEQELKEGILVGLLRNWSIYQRGLNGTRVYLCLKGGTVEEYVKRLISTYLDLWLVSGITSGLHCAVYSAR